MHEHGRDICNVRELCDYMEYEVRVISAIRIGKSNKLSKKPRLLKVELQSTDDKNLLMRASKFLKDDPSSAAIFITPLLLPNELTQFKKLQYQCRLLNDKTSPLKNGKNPS